MCSKSISRASALQLAYCKHLQGLGMLRSIVSPTTAIMSKLSYGLNITKKPSPLASRPPPAKRKTIFDEDSDPEDGPEASTPESLQTLGGIQPPSKKFSSQPITRPSPKPSHNGNLASKHTTSKHAQTAQSLDPSIYDYDAVYDSLHAPTASSSSSSTVTKASEPKKPKYMSHLLAASEVRKRDAVRAKEKMLAKEREAEGDEFADKEKFVTAAYKRQQAAMREAEAEEARREKEAEERRAREGGGMKGLYKGLLERDEERHAHAMKKVEEGIAKGPDETKLEEEGKKEKSEVELAREKGAVVNEDGVVVDKRQLLSAGLNAGAAAIPKQGPSPSTGEHASKTVQGQSKMSDRERETRTFEEQLLGKRGTSDGEDEGEAARAAKSRKMEDEILGLIGR